MKKAGKWLCIFLPVAVLLIAAHPQAVKIHYADPTAGAHDVGYSYYTAPLEFGNLCPLTTILLAVVLVFLGAWTAFWENKFLRKMMLVTAIIAAAASLVNILYGSMTFLGTVITALLIGDAASLWYMAYR